MKLLLDTCTFLWLNSDLSKIPERIRRLCTDDNNQLYLSAVSAWEIAVKHRAGKLKLRLSPQEYVTQYRAANGVHAMRFREDDAFHLAKLPMIHKDPFDRMLVCQAIGRGMTILTPDPDISQYPVLTTW